MRKPRRRAEETREDILAAAEALLRQDGVAGFSIANVASRLSMSPANVFKHFHSKAALADAICDRHVMEMIGRFDTAPPVAAPPHGLGEAVRRLMDIHLADIRESRVLFELLMQMSESDLPSGRRYKAQIDMLFSRIVAEGVAAGIYHCATDEAFCHTVGLAFVGVLHPIMLMHASEDELNQRCEGLVALINAALQNPLAK